MAAFAAADLVACEDTRRTGLLLHNLGIKKPLVSLHEHNERARVSPTPRAHSTKGQTVAVASDAGTPLLSDPGYVLTRAAIAAGHRVEAIPGASAPLVALAGLRPAALSVHLRRLPAAQERQAQGASTAGSPTSATP